MNTERIQEIKSEINELKEKLRSLIPTEEDVDEYDDWGYYDDDYYEEDESRAAVVFEHEKIIPLTYSDKTLLLLVQSKPLKEIFNDCSIYLLGYKDNELFEYVLSRNIGHNKYPLVGVVLNNIDSGLATRFEVVSNTDLFCFFSGGIGMSSNHPLRLSYNYLMAGGLVQIDRFRMQNKSKLTADILNKAWRNR